MLWCLVLSLADMSRQGSPAGFLGYHPQLFCFLIRLQVSAAAAPQAGSRPSRGRSRFRNLSHKRRHRSRSPSRNRGRGNRRGKSQPAAPKQQRRRQPASQPATEPPAVRKSTDFFLPHTYDRCGPLRATAAPQRAHGLPAAALWAAAQPGGA